MTLDELLNQGWSDHADKTEAVAGRLEEGADLVVDDGGAARFLGLANHAIGDHLHARARAAALCERVVKQLGAAAGSGTYVQLAVARRLAGDDAGADAAQAATGDGDPAIGVRVGLLVAQGRLHAGEWTEAEGLYRAGILAADGLDEGHGAERAAAVVSNTVASELLELSRRTPAQDALMVDAAEVSARYWGRIGTWVNEERGDYLKSSVAHAVGDHPAARAHAERGLATIAAADGEEPVDEAFLHLARATACRDAGDAEAQAASLATARGLADAFEDDGLKAWFAEELAKAL